MLRTPDGFLQESSKVFRPTPADRRIIRALLQAAQTKAKDVELDMVSLDTRVEAAYWGTGWWSGNERPRRPSRRQRRWPFVLQRG